MDYHNKTWQELERLAYQEHNQLAEEIIRRVEAAVQIAVSTLDPIQLEFDYE